MDEGIYWKMRTYDFRFNHVIEHFDLKLTVPVRYALFLSQHTDQHLVDIRFCLGY